MEAAREPSWVLLPPLVVGEAFVGEGTAVYPQLPLIPIHMGRRANTLPRTIGPFTLQHKRIGIRLENLQIGRLTIPRHAQMVALPQHFKSPSFVVKT